MIEFAQTGRCVTDFSDRFAGIGRAVAGVALLPAQADLGRVNHTVAAGRTDGVIYTCLLISIVGLVVSAALMVLGVAFERTAVRVTVARAFPPARTDRIAGTNHLPELAALP